MQEITVLAQGAGDPPAWFGGLGFLLVLAAVKLYELKAKKRKGDLANHPGLLPTVISTAKPEVLKGNDEGIWQEMEPEEDPQPARFRDWPAG